MLMQRMFLSMALLAGVVAGSAWAQDLNGNPDQNPGQEAAKAAAARLEAQPEVSVMSVYALGSVNVGTKGDVFIDVQSARETNGAGLQALVGKSLKVTGKCVRQLKQMERKTVELRGQVKDNKEFEVFSFTGRRTPGAAESPTVQGAIAPVGAPRGAINAKGANELPSASGNRPPIGALNNPEGAGANKPNRGVIGTLQGRKKPVETETLPDAGQPVVSVAGALR